MSRQFTRHYTLEQARALLPQVRQWLHRLGELHVEVERYDRRLSSLLASGHDLGGPVVRSWLEAFAAFQETLQEFRQREIQVKDLERGLIDFPSLLGGKEVFLCWEQGEDDIEFWHDLESGYAGRQRL
jgi:hypothetical protein